LIQPAIRTGHEGMIFEKHKNLSEIAPPVLPRRLTSSMLASGLSGWVRTGERPVAAAVPMNGHVAFLSRI
jgi:hypothetical protein